MKSKKIRAGVARSVSATPAGITVIAEIRVIKLMAIPNPTAHFLIVQTPHAAMNRVMPHIAPNKAIGTKLLAICGLSIPPKLVIEPDILSIRNSDESSMPPCITNSPAAILELTFRFIVVFYLTLQECNQLFDFITQRLNNS